MFLAPLALMTQSRSSVHLAAPEGVCSSPYTQPCQTGQTHYVTKLLSWSLFVLRPIHTIFCHFVTSLFRCEQAFVGN